jgi:hypothetical protein
MYMCVCVRTRTLKIQVSVVYYCEQGSESSGFLMVGLYLNDSCFDSKDCSAWNLLNCAEDMLLGTLFCDKLHRNKVTY